jgi:phage terminase large subunit-like protein
VEGRIVAGIPVTLACRRHLRDLEDGVTRGLAWHPERAQHALDFFRDFLVLPDGPQAGEPFVLSSWALFTVGSLHGWFNPDGYRRFRQAFVLTGKGSGKTPVGAGLCVYAMVADAMTGAQCFVAATSRDQAGIPFTDCKRILGPELKARLEILEHNIAMPATGAFIRPISSEARTLDGKRVYFALMDELHEHRDREVVNKMRAGTKGNRESLLFAITNAGENRESICWDFHEKSLKVLNGTLEDDEWFAYVCQLDPCAKCRKAGHIARQDGCPDCDDWRDEQIWVKTNPLVGVTIPESYLRAEVKNAVDIPSSESMVRRLNFCEWLTGASRWFTADQWAACGMPVDQEALKGRPSVLGIDLANTRDLAAAVLICPTPDFFAEITTDLDGNVTIGEVAGGLDVLCWVWCPEATVLEQSKRGVPYDAWVRSGALIATSGDAIDHRAIRRHIVALRSAGYWIQEIAYDPAFSVQFAQDLQDQDAFVVVPIAQDYRMMTEPCSILETLVVTRRLRHGNTPVLRYAAANVILERDGGGRMRPSKKKSDPNGKIDPISALVTGLKRLHVLRMSQQRAEPIMGPPRATAGMPW